MRFRVKKGLALVIVIVFILLMAIIAASFVLISSTEIRMVRRQNDSVRAFYLAEAGAQRAVYSLCQDFEGATGSPSWADGDIDGIDVTQGGTVTIPQNRDETKTIDDPAQPFYSLYSSVSLGGGSYSVWLLNRAGKSDEVYVKSTGTCQGSTRTITVFATGKSISIWDVAIFGGAAGASGTLINGNVDIRGAVLILGTSLGATDYAIDMSGSANIGNNYSGIPAALSSRIPACPTVAFGSETVESLGAELRVKQGKVGLSGSATAGQADVSGNSCKETLDGVYVTDGYGGNKGASNVNSDNGTANAYDLGNDVTFPGLSDSYTDPDTGTEYSTYYAYAQANGLVISDAAKLSALASLTPTSSFTYSDGTNTISMDGSGNLTIEGIVYLDNDGTLGMAKQGSNKTITYSGSGIIFAEGRVDIDVNLLTDSTFPTTDVLGVITPDVIEFDEANIDVMGAFYAETRVEAAKQTDIAGTLASNNVDMGSQVPSIYQVPSLVNNLPTGMIDSEVKWSFKTSNWQEM